MKDRAEGDARFRGVRLSGMKGMASCTKKMGTAALRLWHCSTSKGEGRAVHFVSLHGHDGTFHGTVFRCFSLSMGCGLSYKGVRHPHPFRFSGRIRRD